MTTNPTSVLPPLPLRLRALAESVKRYGQMPNHSGELHALLFEAADALAAIKAQGDAALAERESCAQLCDDMVLYTGFDCAAAIRAKDSK